VADPHDLGDIGLDLFVKQEAGDGGAAIEQHGRLLRLEKDAGVFAPGAGVAVRRAEESGPHGVTLLRSWLVGNCFPATASGLRFTLMLNVGEDVA
jgi:hypothetical protein